MTSTHFDVSLDLGLGEFVNGQTFSNQLLQ
jgi:hypothetical protein